MPERRQILAIGECMVELAETGDGTYAKGFAGDTFNTAWYAKRLAGDSLRVAYLSAIGDDAASQEMADFMRAAGVHPVLAERPGRSVGLYMISLDRGERSFSYWRSTSAARSLADDLTDLPDLKAGDIAFFSGISLAILPPEGRERLLRVLAETRAKGVRTAFDPNLRPRLWESDDEMRDWITRASSVADIALPSYEDEETYFHDADKAATAARYRAQGVGLCVVKDGPGAVLIVEDAHATEVTPTPVQTVVDTTAAGDSFNAQFFVALLRGDGTAEAVQQACALSAKVIAARGALVEI